MLLNIYTSSAIFVDLLLKSIDRKNNMQTIFTETPGEEFSPIGKCNLIIKKRGNQLKYFQALQCHAAIMFPWYFQLQPEDKILYKCQLFLEINGCNRLWHSGDSWKSLSIISKSYLSYMWHEHMPMTSVTSLVKPGTIPYLLLLKCDIATHCRK